MPLDFAAPPLTPGTVWTGTDGCNYQRGGTKWVLQPSGAGSPFLPLAGVSAGGGARNAVAGV